MNNIKLIGIFTILSLSACASTAEENITNYTAKGSLESPNPASCIAISELNNNQNPADIFTGVLNCLKHENYVSAARLYIVSMSYGFFDTKRVSDRSAHQAISVLRMNAFEAQSEDTLKKLQSEINNLKTDNTKLCSALIKLGAPTYKPTYMIQHGMGAFTGQETKDGLIENFDTALTWKESITAMAKCTQG